MFHLIFWEGTGHGTTAFTVVGEKKPSLEISWTDDDDRREITATDLHHDAHSGEGSISQTNNALNRALQRPHAAIMLQR